MRSFLRRRVVVAYLIIAGCASAALGQAGVFPLPSPTGNELITLQGLLTNGQPSPVVNVVKINTVRNTTGYTINAATSGTQSMTVAQSRIFTTGTNPTMTLNLPPNPPDGQMAEIINGAGASTGTLTM